MYVCRFRQVVANIEQRQNQRREFSMSLMEWQTQTLATFIAATVQTDKGKKNPLLEMAAKIKLPIPGRSAAEKAEAEPTDVPEGMSEEDYIFEHGSQVAAQRNAGKSLDAMMGGMGGSMQMPRE